MHSVAIGRARDHNASLGRPARALTVRLHSFSSGVEAGTLGREWVYQPDGRAGSRMRTQSRAALNGKCFGSRVGYLPERHAGTRMRAIASLHSAWKRTGSRAGLSAGRAHWYTHAGNRARTLRGDALGRERVYRPDMYAATRIRHNRPALTVEIHRASRLQQWLSPPDPALPTSHAGTLTVENHSASSGPRRRISTCMRIRRCDDGCTQRVTGRQSRTRLAGRSGTDTHR